MSTTDELSGGGLVAVSSVAGNPIFDHTGEIVGKLVDLVARFDSDGYPPVTGVLAAVGDAQVFVPIKRLTAFEFGTPRLDESIRATKLDRFERRPGELLLRRDVLGHKLIHLAEHRKPHLVKAREIKLGMIDASWRVRGVDTARPRRLLRGKPERTNHAPGEAAGSYIDWTDLEPLVSHVPTSRLHVRYRKLARVHPSAIADLVEEGSEEEGEEIIAAVRQDRELEADVFEELDEEHQLDLISRRSDADAASLLASMAADDAADLLADIEQSRRQPILRLMPWAAQQRLRNLLGYNPETAGGLMNPAAICVRAGNPVSHVLERIRSGEEPPEVSATVYVVSEDGDLTGSVSVVELLRADPSEPVGNIVRSDVPRVSTGSDLPEISTIMADYNLTSVPVLTAEGEIAGQVTVDDLLELIVPESWKRRSEAIN